MKWSYRIGEIGGIGLHVHATFLLLVAFIGIAELAVGGSVAGALVAVAFLLSLFACVVLHELGHAFAARRYGIRTFDITLLPIGGVARLERIPRDPRQELAVALAGPAVNVAIAAVLGLWLLVTGSLPGLSLFGGSFAAQLLAVNLGLVAFNLLPAFPMDGGRVLRALLAMRLPYARATRIAARTGKVMAVLFAAAALFASPFLLLIAAFVWFAGSREAEQAIAQSAFEGVPALRAMRTDFRVLAPHQTLADAIELSMASGQQDFPVVKGMALAGVLVQEDLLAALRLRGPLARVEEVMRRETPLAQGHEGLDACFRRLHASTLRMLPVVHDGRVVGLITLESLGGFARMLGAVRGRPAFTPPRG